MPRCYKDASNRADAQCRRSAGREELLEQLDRLGEIGHDKVGAGFYESGPFAGVEAVTTDLVAGDADGQAVAFTGFAKLDRPVTEDGKLRAAKVVLAHDPVDHHLLGA